MGSSFLTLPRGNALGDALRHLPAQCYQNKSIGADSSAGNGLPGALLPPSSLTLGGVSSLLNSSKNAFGVLGVAARPLSGSTRRLRMPGGSAC
ncbi:DUF1534 domain-containing protein [Pseudomonas savastanoi pv. phaseolicola]|nr:DUF1534 domain-containing protein [Pseudomonas savastanoi pv. phaseolicola]QDV98786.1 DUF1534 domain-containing protein [Pseudomonas sp. KBS0707]QED82537.1 DUF1534 domain-containing protein [Pseudomonas amygdali pv. tabaci str. ATCC 11528]QOI02807.1 DUF1534 domain-containing protein [Pseudomonas savastanoi]